MNFTKPSLPSTHPPRAPRQRVMDDEKASMRQQIRRLSTSVAGLEAQLDAMRRSTSWRVSAPLRWLSGRLKGKAIPAEPVRSKGSYADWIRLYDTAAPQAPGGQRAFSIVVPLAGGRSRLSSDFAASVVGQDYPHWHALVVGEPEALGDAAALLAGDPRAARRFSFAETAEGLTDWTVWVQPGTRLAPHALTHLAAEIAGHPDARVIYADEDALDAEGRRVAPRFKPAWNLELFLAGKLVSGLVALDQRLVDETGGFRKDFAKAAGFDLLLRSLGRVSPGQIRRIPRVLSHSPAQGDAEALAIEAEALAAHFERDGFPVRIEESAHGHRVRYGLPVDLPLVSLIIPTRNALGLLRQCIESIVGITTYPNYEILLVDNGSDDPDALAYLAELRRQPGFTVVRDDRPFNYSALNNLAARQARGDILGLVNNDIEVITPGWLEEMVALALQPGVGPVGAKLLYPDETVQHAGVLLGVCGVAGHANRSLPAGQGGYMDRASSVQSFSAVTGACMLVRKSLYEQVGGLNEVDLKIAYNDVDFCLRLREAGFRTVWTPHAELFHHESASRGSDMTPEKRQRFDQEQDYMRTRWASFIADDPAYNPNLTLDEEDFGLAWPPRVPWAQGAGR